jgi:hypothetical protein
MAQPVYISGTNIPSMTKKFGAKVRAAGIRARTQGLRDVQNALNQKLAGGVVTVIGGKQLKMNMAAITANIISAVQIGAGEAVAYLHYDIEKTPPTTPVGDTGNLRASWFSTPIQENRGGNVSKFGVLAGYGTDKGVGNEDKEKVDYAVYVHEMTEEAYGKKINWSLPGSGAKFLEYGAKRNTDEMVVIVAKNVKMATTL